MFLAIPAAIAADTPPVTSSDVQGVLDMVKGGSLYGANAAEMNQFAGMVNTEELAKVAARLSEQLQAQGVDPNNVDMNTAGALVAQLLTQQDVEKILGYSITSDEFHRGVKTGSDPDNLNSMVQMLQTR